MLNSDIIEEIIQEFVSFGSVEGGKSEYEASNHAKNTLQMEKAAEATIEKKSKKIHSDIMDVIDTKSNKIKNKGKMTSEVDQSPKSFECSEQSDRIKISSLIMNERIRREYKAHWRKASKELVLWKGVWRDKTIFDENPDKIPVT